MARCSDVLFLTYALLVGDDRCRARGEAAGPVPRAGGALMDAHGNTWRRRHLANARSPCTRRAARLLRALITVGSGITHGLIATPLPLLHLGAFCIPTGRGAGRVHAATSQAPVSLGW